MQRMRHIKPTEQGTASCSKNRGRLGICLGLPIEAIAGRKLPKTSCISEVMCFACSDSCENGIRKEKELTKCACK